MKLMEVHEVTIDDYNFYIKPFPAFVSANISGELFKILGPMLGALAPVIQAVSDKDGNVTLDNEAITAKALPMLSTVFSQLTGDEFERLMKKLLIDNKNVSAEGEATDDKTAIMTYDLANEIFCQNILGMYMLCFEVIKLNFGSFFGKFLGSLSGSQQESTTALKSASGAPSTRSRSRNSK